MLCSPQLPEIPYVTLCSSAREGEEELEGREGRGREGEEGRERKGGRGREGA